MSYTDFIAAELVRALTTLIRILRGQDYKVHSVPIPDLTNHHGVLVIGGVP